MVESKFGLEVVDNIIEKSELTSEGIYTSVGTYEFNEMVDLLTNLSNEVQLPANDLLHAFGLYLFDSLGKAHPEVIQSYNAPLGLLYSVEDHIHVHVKKLNAVAELPTFTVIEKTDTSLSMNYASSRRLYSLAHGLVEKTFTHFNKNAQISYELLKDDGMEVKFDIIHMDKEISSTMFNKKFITKWLFDVEIFMRIRKYYGKNDAKRMICEQPFKS